MILDLMRETGKEFPRVESPADVRALRVWHCKYKSLSAIADFVNLEELVIATFPDATLDVVASLKKLRYLSIIHLPKISTLQPLSRLPCLEALSLATSPAWDSAGKCISVESFSPLSSMTGLKHLELFGVCSANRSLAELESCKGLLSARFSQFPKAEVERFYRATGIANQFNPKPSMIGT